VQIARLIGLFQSSASAFLNTLRFPLVLSFGSASSGGRKHVLNARGLRGDAIGRIWESDDGAFYYRRETLPNPHEPRGFLDDKLFNYFLTSRRDILFMTRDDLEQVWGWANDKLATGEQPPWAWEQYVKLCEMLDVISARMAGNKVSSSSRYTQRQSAHLRLIANSVNNERRPARPSY
jgi:hypothetical protein